MPELAEIETLKLYLLEHIINDKIINYTQRRNKIRYDLSPQLSNLVPNVTITGIKRRAKYLQIYLSNDYILIYHLGMSGRLTIEPQGHCLRKHDHVIIDLLGGRKLIFNDARRFGMVYISHINQLNNQPYLTSLGPEPLEDNFTPQYLHKKLSNKNIAIKLALMDNKIVVGVGNIYASESLFRARIHPERASNSLTKEETQLLIISIQKVLQDAINAGGTTLRDFVGANGEPGYFKQKLYVYAKEGAACNVCEGKILKIKQSGRSSFFCPDCQK